jgi:hypothetical protein
VDHLFVRIVTSVKEAAAMIQILWHFVVTQQYVLDIILVSIGIFQEFTDKSLLTQAAHTNTIFSCFAFLYVSPSS